MDSHSYDFFHSDICLVGQLLFPNIGRYNILLVYLWRFPSNAIQITIFSNHVNVMKTLHYCNYTTIPFLYIYILWYSLQIETNPCTYWGNAANFLLFSIPNCNSITCTWNYQTTIGITRYLIFSYILSIE